MPSKTVEGPLAFMPTSNDAIYISPRSSTKSSCRPIIYQQNGKHDYKHDLKTSENSLAVYSSSTSPNTEHSNLLSKASSATMESGNQSNKPSRFTSASDTQREQVPSASAIPVKQHERAPTDSTYWHNLYLETVQNHNSEKVKWENERSQYVGEIQSLNKKLGSRDSAVSGMGSSARGSEQSEVDQRGYNFDAIARESQEKLRQISNVSPFSSGRNTRNPSQAEGQPKVYQAPGRQQSSGTAGFVPPQPFASGSAPVRDVSQLKSWRVSEPAQNTIEIQEAREHTAVADPPSDNHPQVGSDPRRLNPSMSTLGSPDQGNLTLHAGHTPIDPRSSISQSSKPINIPPGRSSKAPPQGYIFDGSSRSSSLLESPLNLPTSPSGNPDMLTALQSRLQQVAENPKLRRPQVMRDRSISVTSETSVVFPGEATISAPSVAPATDSEEASSNKPGSPIEVKKTSTSPQKVNEEPSQQQPMGDTSRNQHKDDGIRLRSARSMNFGAPLGEGPN